VLTRKLKNSLLHIQDNSPQMKPQQAGHGRFEYCSDNNSNCAQYAANNIYIATKTQDKVNIGSWCSYSFRLLTTQDSVPNELQKLLLLFGCINDPNSLTECKGYIVVTDDECKDFPV
jgi:hypothetical protein